jgi:hypothetical protein
MAVPQITQGVLNRIRAHVTVAGVGNNVLDVPATSLTREGIRLTLEGNASDYFPTMTGAVPSPTPYQIATLTLNLVKTMPVSWLYQNQFQTNCLLGQVTVYPDVATVATQVVALGQTTSLGIGVYVLYNCVLESVNAMAFSGEEPSYVVTIKGYILVNSNFFN